MQIKTLEEIRQKVLNLPLPSDIDLVVGIARGGIVPAYLVANSIARPVEFLWVNFRDDDHQQQRAKPELLREPQFEFRGKKVLLVEDRVNTGASLEKAKSSLSGAEKIITLAVNGPADFSLFDDDCFIMPWNFKAIAGKR